MYTKHFGLKKLPFENVPDPAFFFDEGDYARVHNRIKESLKAGRGLTVVTGPIGSGKTTLSHIVEFDFADNIKQIWMAEPPGSSMDLFLYISEELGLTPSNMERVFVLRDIKDELVKISVSGNKCLLIIDESHLMTDDVLNGIRMLNNLEEGATKLIQILLLGQEEFMEKINRPEMEPFKQRIATLEVLGKMDPERIRKYVSHRIQKAGGQPSLLADTGWEAIFKAFGAGSTPRLINSLCDRSLNAAFERQKIAVDVDDVYEAAQGTGLQKEIFFYKIAINKGEKKEKPSIPGNGDSAGKPDTAIIGSTQSLSADRKGIEADDARDVKSAPQRVGTGIEGEYSRSEKGLKVPLILLIVSIVVFLFSISFYCQRSGSPDFMSCLEALIGY